MSDNNNAELFTALAQAQAAFKLVETDQKVDFPIQGGRRVIYDYASFAAIFKMAQKPLTDNGLSVHQVMLDGNLITTLAHSSGQSVSSISPLPTGGDIKQLGANLSYLRRYQYTAIVGAVVGGEDNEEAVEGDVEETSKQVDNGKSSKPKKTEKQSDPWPAKSGPVFEFCQNVRERTPYFTNQYHLANALPGGFGDLTDPANFNSKVAQAVKHATERANEKAAEESE